MANSTHPDMVFWRERVLDWYPDLFQKTYFVPPVHMNRTKYEEEEVSSVKVLVTQSPVQNQTGGVKQPLLQSDVRDDEAQQRVLRCLHQLSATIQKEVMFVLSQLQFGNYLNKPCYAAATATLPKPADLKAQNKHRGDFDVLIIHRHYGLLVGEIKAIGDKLSSFSQQEQDQQLEKKTAEGIRQLQKAEDVLQHLMSDFQPLPRIRKRLMFPNVPLALLQRMLTHNPQLRQELRQCLSGDEDLDPSLLCLTSETLQDPNHWWHQWTQEAGVDSAMIDTVFLDLVSRFAGPATTITVFCSTVPRLAQTSRCDVRTLGEGVQETASRFAPQVDIVLHPKQVAVLNSQESLVMLAGPPGCGKSLALVVKALCWLWAGRSVRVLSSGRGTLAASHMIVNQLQMAVEASARERIHLDIFDILTGWQTDEALEALTTAAEGGQLYVIADEITVETEYIHPFTTFCSHLLEIVPRLHMWAASMYRQQISSVLAYFVLSEPLRTPPSTTREIQQSGMLQSQDGPVCDYTASPSPLPSDGLTLRQVLHYQNKGGHSAGETKDCQQCGREVGKVLLDLNVGGTSRSSNSPPALHYSDVFILTSYSDFHDTELDSSGQVRRPANGLLLGLRDAGLPVTVVKTVPESDRLRDVATGQGLNHVIAADSDSVLGLERKVVVWVHTMGTSEENFGRLQAVSRCTAQLIWVKPCS